MNRQAASCTNAKSEIRNTRSFTLIELLVVVAIIAVLVSILLPALSAARDAAKTVACLSNQRQAGIVFQQYFDMYYDVIPPASWWPQPPMAGVDYRIWAWLLLDAGLVRHGVGPNDTYPEVIALNAGTYPEGVWRCPAGDASPDWWMNQTHYGMSGNLTHIDPVVLPRRKWYMRVTQLPDPGAKALLADSLHSGLNHHAIYIEDPAYYGMFRHRDATNLLFFDGHAVTKARGPNDPVMIFSRFVNDFCKYAGWNDE